MRFIHPMRNASLRVKIMAAILGTAGLVLPYDPGRVSQHSHSPGPRQRP
jgi:hypothetical protein